MELGERDVDGLAALVAIGAGFHHLMPSAGQESLIERRRLHFGTECLDTSESDKK